MKGAEKTPFLPLWPGICAHMPYPLPHEIPILWPAQNSNRLASSHSVYVALDRICLGDPIWE